MTSRPRRAMRRCLAVTGLALAVAGSAFGDLTGSTVDMNLVQVHPTFGYDLSFAHVYGTTSTVSDPLYPTLPISVITPGGVLGRDHSIELDYSQNQYGDFAGFTGTLAITNIGETVDGPSVALVNEASQLIGSIASDASSISVSWNVDDVLSAGTGTRVYIAWNSVPTTTPAGPQPRMGEPLLGLSSAELARFDAGRIAFSRELTVAEGLGPVFNQSNCAGCHINPIGGAGSQTVVRFGRSDKGVFTPLDAFGGSLLQALAIDEGCAETVPVNANVTSLRVTNGALGYGLIEAIPDAALLALESAGPGVSGRAHVVEALETPGVPRVGRFGWKAQLPTIRSFSADAALNEMGLTSSLLPDENDPNGDLPPDIGACDTVADPEDSPALGGGVDLVTRVTDFQRLLAAPPQTPRSGMTGEAVFGSIGCVDCHTPSFVTADDAGLEDALRNRTIRPYADFLLHDMGLAADFIAQGDATGRELRTPPLWGLRTRDPLWHDGRFGGGTFADRVTLAIAEHGVLGSEAAGSVTAWDALDATEWSLVIAFLDSLGRAELDADGDGDVELDDFAAFMTCVGTSPTPDDACAIADVDQDGDVDGDDFDTLLLVYDGPANDCNNNGVDDLRDVFDGTSADADGNGVPDECAACPADLTGDGDTGFADLTTLLAAWGPCGGPCDEDLDGSGEVGFADLTMLLAAWGPC